MRVRHSKSLNMIAGMKRRHLLVWIMYLYQNRSCIKAWWANYNITNDPAIVIIIWFGTCKESAQKTDYKHHDKMNAIILIIWNYSHYKITRGIDIYYFYHNVRLYIIPLNRMVWRINMALCWFQFNIYFQQIS